MAKRLAPPECSAFAALDAETRAAIQEKQRAKKLAKQQAKLASCPQDREDEEAAVDAPRDYPPRITKREYFQACGGRFRDKDFAPTEENLERLLQLLRGEGEQARRLAMCNYFQFGGSAKSLWDPVFNAKLAYEGFFTITTSSSGFWGSREPLPELQPFYSVLTWPNFAASKHVRKALGQIKRGAHSYRLANNANPTRTWKMLDDYHKRKYGSNWLTEKYFVMMKAGSANPEVNFRLNCVELFVGDADVPIAGEIGFSIGQVYTSLSGFVTERSSDSHGTAQLVLLGQWLKQRGYAFWSLGHCYSPEMDYKRQLGHRIYPRADFLALLKQHRGAFRLPAPTATPTAGKTAEAFLALAEGESCKEDTLLHEAEQPPPGSLLRTPRASPC